MLSEIDFSSELSSLKSLDLKAETVTLSDEDHRVLNDTSGSESFAELLGRSENQQTSGTEKPSEELSKNEVLEVADKLEKKIDKMKKENAEDEELLSELDEILEGLELLLSEPVSGQTLPVSDHENWGEVLEVLNALDSLLSSAELGNFDFTEEITSMTANLQSLLSEIGSEFFSSDLKLDSSWEMNGKTETLELGSENESELETTPFDIEDNRTAETVKTDAKPLSEVLTGQSSESPLDEIKAGVKEAEISETAEVSTETTEGEISLEFSEDTHSESTKSIELPSPVAVKTEVSESAQNAYTSLSNPVSRANVEALLNGIAGKAQITLEDGKSEMRMKLFPPELGKMSVKFNLEDGNLRAHIVVSTPEAKALFDDNLFEMYEALEQSGVDTASIDVSVFSGSSQEADAFFGDDSEGFDGFSVTDTRNSGAEEMPELQITASLMDSMVNFIA